ncbi:hypothetical protein Lgra_2854 [Legionella gratiana]|uniref:Uncharacterized protein n=1 Tax=Legionella gratiana TaxID=45066 RepID=A0A378J4U7_9GAMM|nr:hypothetical protein [Legionella gratiana]KTD06077.1 hypothetical protein Lgra_2854 [Legionella gratiana]STX42794.1 Uncharacterised protein [Legionella gratiana]
MPSDVEKLLEQINSAQQKLQKKAEKYTNLPMQLKTEIESLCKETISRLEELRSKDPKDPQTIKDLQTIKENLDKTNFLVDSVNLTLTVKKTNPSFLPKIANETRRIGKTFNEMTYDDSRSMGNKLWTCMKSVVTTCLDTAIGASKGMRQGFVENEGFFKTMGGVLKGAATGAVLGASRGFADSFMNDGEKAKKMIANLREDHGNELLELYEKIKNEKDPAYPANKARIEILKEEGKYLSELERRLESNPNDKKVHSEIVGSLRTLSLTSAGSALMHTALEVIHDFSSPQKFGGLEGAKALENLGKDVVSAAKNFNAILDNSQTALPSKLFSLTKAFAMSAWEGVKGCMKGLAEGFQQGKGLSTIGSTIKGALFSGFSGAVKGFNQSLEKDLSLTAPSGSNKKVALGDTPLVPDNDKDLDKGLESNLGLSGVK